MYTAEMFPIVTVQGDPYECGIQHGKAVSNLIHKNIDVYLQLIEFHSNLSPSAAFKKAEKYITYIESYDVKLVEEMQGIADGSGRKLAEIMLLNARTEMLSAIPLRECTSMAILPPASDNVWLAQNWDWLHLTTGLTILLKVKQLNKPSIFMMAEAGQIGKMGFNEVGIGLCHNALDANYHKIGLPFIIICRVILNQWQLNDAINVLCESQRASSGNYLIAHKGGFAIDFEVTPDKFDFFEPEKHILVHTNHFLSKQFQSDDNVLARNGWDSVIRKQRAARLLEQEYGEIHFETISKIQSDLAFGTSSICVLPSKNMLELAQWSTLAGIIMNLSSMEIFVAPGLPCDVDYIKVDA